ncbi:MAG: response regulator [Candidatus Nomurabacteria bacterium]|jgi:DNA-binding response OmpR family regulator|nr:response regulator [Candidatus Nomurabacteria bacterium]
MNTNKSKIVALIEDDDTISMMYRTKFELEGFKVNVAANGRTGIAMVEQEHPHIILLDINMPEMSGFEALKNIRKLPRGQEIPVVVLTNLGQHEAPHGLDALGVSKYIVKANLTPRQVVEEVEAVLSSI